MKVTITAVVLFITFSYFSFNCNTPTGDNTTPPAGSMNNKVYGSYASQAEWGKHLVTIGGCEDCHTPKKMTAQGPVNDTTKSFGGALSTMPVPDITPQQLAKGIAATTDQTEWIGPWGKSFAANISSDNSGIGGWREQQFIDCLRKGILKGLANTRPLMPPMPWQDYSQMTDAELKAVFAYLKTTKPVKNIVPQYEPPAAAAK